MMWVRPLRRIRAAWSLGGEMGESVRRPPPIWWVFDYSYPPPRTRILMGVGMTKIDFARKVAEARGWDPRKVYPDVYGGAWWRVTDPAMIAAAYGNLGRIISYDAKTAEVLGVLDV